MRKIIIEECAKERSDHVNRTWKARSLNKFPIFGLAILLVAILVIADDLPSVENSTMWRFVTTTQKMRTKALLRSKSANLG